VNGDDAGGGSGHGSGHAWNGPSAPTEPPPRPPSAPLNSAPLPPAEFAWRECDTCLVGVDAHGNAIDVSGLPPRERSGLRVHVELETVLLYWAERRQWMWHKKWSLPKITVRVERDDTGSNGQPPAAHGVERLCVVVSAGTLRDELSVLEDQGLGGDCQRVLELRAHGASEVSFTRLLFQRTSFNCGGRPFHLVVTIAAAPPRSAPQSLTPADGAVQPGMVAADGSVQALQVTPSPMPCMVAGDGEAIPMAVAGVVPDGGMAALMPVPGAPNAATARAPMQPLCCVCSSPVRVDARKRSKGERPEAAEDDVRLVNRQRPASGTGAGGHPANDVSYATTAQAQPGSLGGGGALNADGESAAPSVMHPGHLGETRFASHALLDATSDAFVEVSTQCHGPPQRAHAHPHMHPRTCASTSARTRTCTPARRRPRA
jgi:hypothetical protein